MSKASELLLIDRVQVVPEELVHLEHVDLCELEHGAHLLIASYLPLVVRILEVVAFDMLPEFLDDLWSG